MRAPERTLLMLAAALLPAAPLAAQAAAARPAANPAAEAPATLPEADVYRREVFQYQAGGRPDPFRPLLSGDDMGVRVQDLRLVGIIASPNPRTSVAVFTLPTDSSRLRLRVGQRLGAVTVTAIHPRRVDLREDALGVSRTYSLELQRTPRPPATPGRPAPAPAPAQAAPQPAPARP
jgi:hypothetical protein